MAMVAAFGEQVHGERNHRSRVPLDVLVPAFGAFRWAVLSRVSGSVARVRLFGLLFNPFRGSH